MDEVTAPRPPPPSPLPQGEGESRLAPPILSVRKLRTHFFQDEGIVRAVDGASFALHRGRTLGIVGESGCGKSVTARSILRIVERPGRIVGGEILLRRQDGTIIDLTRLKPDSASMRAIRGGEIGLVFQEPMSSLSAYHTVGNQLVEAIRLHTRLSKKAARERAIELLAMVGIPRPAQRIDAYSFQLSGGLRQRVMIALALAAEPRILIADEPTTALDVTTQAQILELLRRLQDERGLAVMLITHDMGVIAEMADDVVVMYLGREVEKGRWIGSSTLPAIPTPALCCVRSRACWRSLARSWPRLPVRSRTLTRARAAARSTLAATKRCGESATDAPPRRRSSPKIMRPPASCMSRHQSRQNHDSRPGGARAQEVLPDPPRPARA
jgi:ABC-type dipeptide/oligopeptide/nickel transport system ATPase component